MPLLKFNPPTEAEEQEAFFKRVRLLEGKYPFLKLVFMIPNGAYLGADRQRYGAKLKLQGLQPSVPDIFCAVSYPTCKECQGAGILYEQIRDGCILSSEDPIPCYRCKGNTGSHGLFVEMKRINAMPSDTTQAQRDYHHMLRMQGYKVLVCKGWIAAWNALAEYLSLKGEEVR